MDNDGAKRLLDGLRILDFSQTWTGPTTTRQFADWGAVVLKVETPERPDIMRLSSPFKGEVKDTLDSSAIFAVLNTNKLSLTIDLKTEEGRGQLLRLLKWADVVIESFAPGVAKRLGIDYESARQVNPEVIVLSHTLLGQTGPYSALRGMGFLTSAMSGWQSATRYGDDSTPFGPYSAYGDFISWGFMALSILAALERRRKTGHGVYIDQAQMESSTFFALHTLADAWVNGAGEAGGSNSHALFVPHGCYPCVGSDNWCAIAVTSEQEWQRFCDALGQPEWVSKHPTISLRVRGRHEIDRDLSAWTSKQKVDDVVGRLRDYDVLAEKVHKASDVVSNERLGRHAFRRLPHPVMGDYLTLLSAFRMWDTPEPHLRPAPMMGEHNDQLGSIIQDSGS